MDISSIDVENMWVHIYERYQRIPVVLVYLILLDEGAHQGFSSAPMASGSVEAGNVLSFVESTEIKPI